MSGTGGYYKYRCKYFYSHNCPHWVWVNYAPCAHCLAEGRDSDIAITSSSFRPSPVVCVPALEDGTLQYILMEIATSNVDSGWSSLTKKDAHNQPFPATTEPSAFCTAAVNGFNIHAKSGLGLHGIGTGWAVKSSNGD